MAQGIYLSRELHREAHSHNIPAINGQFGPLFNQSFLFLSTGAMACDGSGSDDQAAIDAPSTSLNTRPVNNSRGTCESPKVRAPYRKTMEVALVNPVLLML